MKCEENEDQTGGKLTVLAERWDRAVLTITRAELWVSTTDPYFIPSFLSSPA